MVIDIKDRAPNDELTGQLEVLLEMAKAGELRSIICVCSYDDDSVTHGWVCDERSSNRGLLSELTLMQHEFIVDVQLGNEESVLVRAFDGWD